MNCCVPPGHAIYLWKDVVLWVQGTMQRNHISHTISPAMQHLTRAGSPIRQYRQMLRAYFNVFTCVDNKVVSNLICISQKNIIHYTCIVDKGPFFLEILFFIIAVTLLSSDAPLRYLSPASAKVGPLADIQTSAASSTTSVLLTSSYPF